MKRLILAAASCLMLGATTMPVNAVEPTPIGGGGWDRSWHNRPMFVDGNPTKDRYPRCRVRMAGPYPAKSDVNLHVSKVRVECFSKDDTTGLQVIAKMKKLRNDTPEYGPGRRGDCMYFQHDFRFSSRADSNGHKWWGCTFKMKVRDKRPQKTEDWYLNVIATDTAVGAETTVDLSSVVTYCHDHLTWCQNHPNQVAISYSML